MKRLIALACLICAAGCAHLPMQHDRPIRVLVLNMHAGKDAAGNSNLDGIAALVKQTGADVVLLQEVDRGTKRSGGVDQVARLGESTRYDTAFAPSLQSYDGGQYGIALLSRGFVGFRSTNPLPVSPAETRAGGSHEPRVALLAFATVGKTQWNVLNTHLDPAGGPARAQEVSHLADLVALQLAEGARFVLGGDLNATPDDPALQPLRAAGLRDAWAECGSGDGFTYPADRPIKRIDYLWLSGDLRCASAQVLETQISDHRPVLVTMKP